MTKLADQIARDMREGAFPNKSETTKAEDRARVSYEAFRNGFDGGVLPPEWDKAPAWVRDAIHVAYLQGKLDRE